MMHLQNPAHYTTWMRQVPVQGRRAAPSCGRSNESGRQAEAPRVTLGRPNNDLPLGEIPTIESTDAII